MVIDPHVMLTQFRFRCFVVCCQIQTFAVSLFMHSYMYSTMLFGSCSLSFTSTCLSLTSDLLRTHLVKKKSILLVRDKLVEVKDKEHEPNNIVLYI
jgi:hypothetical protein